MRQTGRTTLALLTFLLLSLGGCDGSLRIDKITPQTVLLVDDLPRESYSATMNCELLVSFHVDALGHDWGISSEIVKEVTTELERGGYKVIVVQPPATAKAKNFPDQYNLKPGSPYHPVWAPEFSAWLHSIGRSNDAGALVILSTYDAQSFNKYSPFISGYGVKSRYGLCIAVPPSEAQFFAYAGISVFTYPDEIRKYSAQRHDGGECEVAAPPSVLNDVKNGTLKDSDLAAYRDVIKNIALFRIRQDLAASKLLTANAGSCPVVQK